MLGDDLIELLGERIPADRARQALADDYLVGHYAAIAARGEGDRVLDLGCGAGDSVEQFRSLHAGVGWVGVDVERSPEVDARTRGDAEFRTFDGRSIPAEDASVDLVYCKQVLEHVTEPAPLIADVARGIPRPRCAIRVSASIPGRSSIGSSPAPSISATSPYGV